MGLARQKPNTILLAYDEDKALIADLAAGEVLTPGMIVEKYRYAAGVIQWRKSSSATNIQQPFIVVDSPAYNKGVEDTYAIGDVVPVYAAERGDVFWGLIPSG